MPVFSDSLIAPAEALLARARTKGVLITTAESCTGGLIAALLTDVSGSSDVFWQGLVTYDNAAKERLLGVSTEDLRAHGAVSEVIACAMAEGAVARLAEIAPANRPLLSIAVTGIAGPTGGTPEKPVGTVHLATCYQDKEGMRHTAHAACQFDGNRSSVRLATVEKAVGMLEEAFI